LSSSYSFFCLAFSLIFSLRLLTSLWSLSELSDDDELRLFPEDELLPLDESPLLLLPSLLLLHDDDDSEEESLFALILSGVYLFLGFSGLTRSPLVLPLLSLFLKLVEAPL